jgi:hypothetical protein
MDEPLIDRNHRPKYEFKDGHFYCDGIRVQPRQMTEEEIRRFIPKSYWPGYFRGKHPCPFYGCKAYLDPNANPKRSWTAHVRNAHGAWYAAHGIDMQACENYRDFLVFVDETEKAQSPANAQCDGQRQGETEE